MDNWILIAAVAVLGLIVGSLLNVVAYRVPLGKSITRPPSACPSCGHPIRPGDNIPLISWLLLRGKCRDCQAPISWRYPVVEAGTAILFGATAAVIGARAVLPAYLWFAGLVAVLVVVDLDHKRIPNRILYPGTVVAVLLLAVGGRIDDDLGSVGRGLVGGLAYFGFLLVLAVVARGGFGMGDVKFGFLLGVFAAHRSWESLAVAAVMAFMVGGVVSIVLLVLRRAGRRDTIPFGPAMAIGVAIGIAAGDPIAAWYLPGG